MGFNISLDEESPLERPRKSLTLLAGLLQRSQIIATSQIRAAAAVANSVVSTLARADVDYVHVY